MEKSRCELCNKDFVNKEALSAHNKSKHKSKSVSSKKVIVIAVAILLIVALIIFAMLVNKPGSTASNTELNNPTGNTQTTTSSDNTQNTASIGDFQTAELSVFGSSYVLSPSTLKVNIAVKITAKPSSLPGCSKTVVIPAFNVFKTVTDSDYTIAFTPNQKGTFNIVCGMNMYRGTFTVV